MVDLNLHWDLDAGVRGECLATFATRLDSESHEEQLPCGASVVTRFETLAGRSNSRVNAPVSPVMALANSASAAPVRPAR